MSNCSRQPSSVLHSPYGSSGANNANKARKTHKGHFLPTPQGLVQLSHADPIGHLPPSPSSPYPSPYPGVGEVKSTSTPERAPASAPELGRVSRTTPNLLKIIAPTKSPGAMFQE